MAPSIETNPSSASPNTEPSITGLVQRILQDAQTLTRDELALAKIELTQAGERAAAGMATLLLAGVFVLISFGLLCVTAVVALAPLVEALWLRMLLMSFVYLCMGSLLVGACVAWLATKPLSLPKAKKQAVETLATLKEEVQHAP